MLKNAVACALKPTLDNVVLEAKMDEKVGRLYLPGSAARRSWEIVAVGPDVKLRSVGEKIVFDNPAAGEIDMGAGKKFIILKEKDIVAVYREGE